MSLSPIDLTYGTDPSYKLKKSNSNVHEAEQSFSEYPCQSRTLAVHSEREGVGGAPLFVSSVGFVLSLSLCLSPSLLLLSLIPSVSWPSDLCRSHVPDSSLS